MKLLTLTSVLTLSTAVGIFAHSPEAHALKVRCSDPQNVEERLAEAHEKHVRENIGKREPTKFVFEGRKVVAENVQNRGQDYAPRPIKKGSNLHECNN